MIAAHLVALPPTLATARMLVPGRERIHAEIRNVLTPGKVSLIELQPIGREQL